MPWRESRGIEISLYIIAFAMVWVLGMAFRSKLSKSDSSELFSNEEYLKSQIAKLGYRYQIAKKYMYIYAVLLVLALNISYYVLLEPLNTLTRIGIHLVLTLSIAGFMHWQMRRKVRKYDRELLPIIQQMEEMLEKKTG